MGNFLKFLLINSFRLDASIFFHRQTCYIYIDIKPLKNNRYVVNIDDLSIYNSNIDAIMRYITLKKKSMPFVH